MAVASKGTCSLVEAFLEVTAYAVLPFFFLSEGGKKSLQNRSRIIYMLWYQKKKRFNSFILQHQ